MTLMIEFDREVDGRWIANIPSLPGVMTYGATREEALENVKKLAQEILAEEREEFGPVGLPEPVTFVAA